MLAQVDEYLEMFVQEEEQQAGEVPWRSCAPSCCCDRCSELLGRARGYLGDLLRLCSGRRIAGGKGAIALTTMAIRAIGGLAPQLFVHTARGSALVYSAGACPGAGADVSRTGVTTL